MDSLRDCKLGEMGLKGKSMEGMASIALLPTGSISGHFIHLPESICYGLQGTELACERECSRGEDYRLIKLSIIDYSSKRERVVVVECRGHDAARIQNIDHAHGWENDVVGMVEEKHGKQNVSVSFECETLKADAAAEEHIKKYMPNLAGLDAVADPIYMGRGLDDNEIYIIRRSATSRFRKYYITLAVNVGRMNISGISFSEEVEVDNESSKKE